MIILLLIFLCMSLSYSLNEDWTIHVYTGTERFAGTDSNVFIRMYNSIYGYTNEYELTQDNWVYGTALFPYKNLFESGEHDQFRISTKNFGFVEKIHVRRDNFPVIRSDWFLDRIIVERNRDSVKVTFICHCWLRTEQPNITLSAFSDAQTTDKTNPPTNQKFSVAVIVSIGIVLITCLICFIRQFFRKRDYRSFYVIQRESLVVERFYIPSAPPPQPPLPPAYTPNRITLPVETIRPPSTITDSSDEPPPPRYEVLFPD